MLFGLVLGYVTFRLLRSVNNYQVEVLLTLAAVTGGYALASRLHVSGPLAMVVVGLIIGNGGRALAMSDTTRHYVDLFWELIDEILNAVLFVLIGMEVLLVAFSAGTLVAAAVAAAVTLLARALTVGLPVGLLHARIQTAEGGWMGADLGRPARRHLGGAGPVAAGRPAARHRARADLLRRRVFDPRPGNDHWACRSKCRDISRLIASDARWRLAAG